MMAVEKLEQVKQGGTIAKEVDEHHQFADSQQRLGNLKQSERQQAVAAQDAADS